MNETSLALVAGAACGVLATFLLLLTGDLWTEGVLPLLRRLVHRGPRIGGEWKGLGTGPAAAEGEWTEVDLSLKQVAAEVQGRMTIRQRRAAHSFDLELQVQGRIADGYLTLGLRSAAKGVRAPGTALLKIEEGRALNGQLLYRDARNDAVDVIDLSVHRTAARRAPRRQAAARPAAVIRPLAAAGASH